MQKNQTQKNTTLPIVVIGGGPAGFFGAITCAELAPDVPVMILEKTQALLSKVRISGGGRCNVTHHCFDPAELVKNYPRGGKALRSPFSRFGPPQMIDWLEKRGVVVKTEDDGRMFPITDSSDTIINCLIEAAHETNVQIQKGVSIEKIEPMPYGFKIYSEQALPLDCKALLVATGSAKPAFSWIQKLGHTLQPLVPSLFTFNVPTSPFLDLSGISFDHVQLKIIGTSLVQTGPLLLTHWGFSGPSVLKLSAWGAKELHTCNYKAKVAINWIGSNSQEEAKNTLKHFREVSSSQKVENANPFLLPKNFWKRLVALCYIPKETSFTMLSNKQLESLASLLTNSIYDIDGKTTYKSEFVTCGGVTLDEVDFKTMQSKIVPNLFFAGEVLDIDAITGGFNFQSCWTTGFVAGQALSTLS